MKTKQLANVLIKILGLSLLVHSISSIIAEWMTMFISGGMTQSGYWYVQLSPLITVIIGIIFIVKSRDIATLLFKNEDE